MRRLTNPRQSLRLPKTKGKRLAPISPLRFTPYAWAKLIFLRDAGPTEVGGFGLSRPGNLLLVEDVCLVPQRCTGVTVAFEDTAVADYFDLQVDQGRLPEEFARIWIHTHPGTSPLPSGTDEATFARCFGEPDWAVMFILAANGWTYARLCLNGGPVLCAELPVELDFSEPFAAGGHDEWKTEYDTCVECDLTMFESRQRPRPQPLPVDTLLVGHDWFDELPSHELPSHELPSDELPPGRLLDPRDWEVAHG